MRYWTCSRSRSGRLGRAKAGRRGREGKGTGQGLGGTLLPGRRPLGAAPSKWGQGEGAARGRPPACLTCSMAEGRPAWMRRSKSESCSPCCAACWLCTTGGSWQWSPTSTTCREPLQMGISASGSLEGEGGGGRGAREFDTAAAMAQLPKCLCQAGLAAPTPRRAHALADLAQPHQPHHSTGQTRAAQPATTPATNLHWLPSSSTTSPKATSSSCSPPAPTQVAQTTSASSSTWQSKGQKRGFRDS